MLDAWFRPKIDPMLNFISKGLIKTGLTATQATLLGLSFGLLAVVAVSTQQYSLGLTLFLLNRLFDGIDGGIARQTQLSDLGGYLDIVCDFIIYSGMIFAFGIALAEYVFWSTFLLFSFIGAMTSFLTYAIIAAKRKIESTSRGKKSFFYLGGISEGFETIVAISAACLYPELFPVIALIYGIMCWLTTLGRIYQAWLTFAD